MTTPEPAESVGQFIGVNTERAAAAGAYLLAGFDVHYGGQCLFGCGSEALGGSGVYVYGGGGLGEFGKVRFGAVLQLNVLDGLIEQAQVLRAAEGRYAADDSRQHDEYIIFHWSTNFLSVKRLGPGGLFGKKTVEKVDWLVPGLVVNHD